MWKYSKSIERDNVDEQHNFTIKNNIDADLLDKLSGGINSLH